MPAKIRVKASIGSRRLSSGTHASIAAATRQARTQMKTVMDNLEAVVQGLRTATPEALLYGLKPIADKATYYVPVKTGELRDSQYMEVRREGRQKFLVELGYARGGHPNYAALVHESVDIPHADPTSAKFLEKAVDEELHKVRPRVLRYLREKLGA